MITVKRFFFYKSKRSLHVIAMTTVGISIMNLIISLLDPNLKLSNTIYERSYSFLNHHPKKYNIQSQSIDIISIGTILKPELQNAQQHTFASHDVVRNFYRITEQNDTDTKCSTTLTTQQFNTIHRFCTRRDEQESRITSLLAQRKPTFNPKNDTGWMCAQKRPIDGIYSVLQQYAKHTTSTLDTFASNNTGQTLPKYLIILDDDTYINITYISDILSKKYAFDKPHMVTGCLHRFTESILFQYPFGGYSSILTRKVIENLIRPIHCYDNSVGRGNVANIGFNRKACWRLSQNLIGEQSYYQDGMSVLDLMYAFSSNLSFTKVEEWTNRTGYCFHSDHALGYFFGFYYIGVPDRIWSSQNPKTDSKRDRGYSYNVISKEFPTCYNTGGNCGNYTTICHYNTPQQMYDLYSKENTMSL
jgi:hypothetical protein